MKDEERTENENESGNESGNSESVNTPAESGQGEELILGKFKSQEDLIKSYKELERKQGGFAEVEREREEYREYISKIQPVIAKIEEDEELARMIRKKMGYETDEPETTDNQPQVEVQEIKNRLKRVEDRDRFSVVADFERKYGIDGLDPEERRAFRGRIEKRLNRWGKSVRTGSPDGLLELLEDAYALENNNELIEKARSEAILRSRQNEVGIVGNQGSIKIGKETVTLTPAERETAKKQGISEKDYLEAKKAILAERK